MSAVWNQAKSNDVINDLWRLLTFLNETESNGQDVTPTRICLCYRNKRDL